MIDLQVGLRVYIGVQLEETKSDLLRKLCFYLGTRKSNNLTRHAETTVWPY